MMMKPAEGQSQDSTQTKDPPKIFDNMADMMEKCCCGGMMKQMREHCPDQAGRNEKSECC